MNEIKYKQTKTNIIIEIIIEIIIINIYNIYIIINHYKNYYFKLNIFNTNTNNLF